MLYEKLLDRLKLTKTSYKAGYLIACSLKLALPRVIVVTGHIVVCVVTGYDHKRLKNNFLVGTFFYLIDDIFTGRSCLNGTYIVVVKALFL